MATELEITKKRYQEIMGRTIDHKHKYNFIAPLYLDNGDSIAMYSCDNFDCDDRFGIHNGVELTYQEARDLYDD